MRLPRLLSALACSFALLLWLAPVASAQQPQVRTLDADATGRTIEVTMDWERPLRVALDSAGVTTFEPRAFTAAAPGFDEADDLINLPALALPGVQVLASDSEEVPLPHGAADTLAAMPLAEVVNLGLFRKQPVVSLRVRLVRYEPESQRLLRYRRVVVRVQYAPTPSGQTAALRAATNPHLAVDRSVLAEGTVFRFAIPAEGVFRIDRDVITRMGLDPATVDPAHVRIYGNGNAPLPARNSDPRVADLAENPVVVQGGGDGRFDAGDAVLFYARGPQGWTYDAARTAWAHYTHPFSREGAVFVKVTSSAARPMESRPYPNSGAPEVRQTLGRFVAEFDEFMWSKEAGSGLTWFTAPFGPGGTRALLRNSDLPGLAPGQIAYESHTAIRSLNVTPAASIRFEAGGATLIQNSFGSVNAASDAPIARSRVLGFQQTYGGGEFTLGTSVIPGAPSPETPTAAVDWVRAFYPQRLDAASGYLRFATPPGQSGPMTLALGGFGSAPEVWDVTDPLVPVRLGVEGGGGAYRVQVAPMADQPREIVAFTSTAVRRLDAAPRRVAAQNLHAPDVYPDLVIVVPDTFRTHAERLADRRRAQGLRVVVSGVEAIYNEFSGGVPDMRAVRDYFKFLYDRAPDDASRLRYALLFGDGHFDYRNLATTDAALRNWIFPFQTEESLGTARTFTSDDYFALLDDQEGLLATSERPDVGVGRFPIQTAADAEAILAKMERYEDPATYGDWRTRYLFVADDGPTPSEHNEDLHVQNADFVAELVKRTSEQVNVGKVYGPSYERVFQTKFRLPGARRDLIRAIEEGQLAVNYSGHGGPEVLADEEIFTRQDAESLTNFDRLPVFITATCSFGRWDMEEQQSAAEALVLNARGGAVAIFTTVRIVYTSATVTTNNVGVNRYLNVGLFTPGDDGLPPRLGDAMLRMKQSPVGHEENSRKFNLLGDPSLRFGVAPLRVTIDEVAGTALDTTEAQLRALDRVTVRGRVVGTDGTVQATYDGRVNLTVFDSQRRVPLPYVRYMPTPYYLQRNDLIWRGTVDVAAGRFEATFVVPKDISYSNERGFVLAYSASGQTHAAGSTAQVRVGGSVPNPPDDGQGPSVRLFLGDTTFVAGSLVPHDPELIVRLADETGINTAGAGVGHEMLLVINGDERSAVDIGALFEADPGAYASGQVRYRLEDLPPGPGTLRVRAWDVLNNSGEASLDFVVSASERLDVRQVLNFPNPMVSGTRFSFEHNQPIGTAARVQIRIYTLTGRPVRTIDEMETLPAGVLGTGRVQVMWDGRDDDGDRLAAGVYLYKVRVEVERDDGSRDVAERIERLAVVR